jgi:hypothetical protein
MGVQLLGSTVILAIIRGALGFCIGVIMLIVWLIIRAVVRENPVGLPKLTDPGTRNGSSLLVSISFGLEQIPIILE